MQDTRLYEQIMGIGKPWSVSKVELDVKLQEVNVWVEHAADAQWICPACGKPCVLYDHAEERSWRHLDTCQFKTYLHARVPRGSCPEHGVVNLDVPWAGRNARFTLMMERLTIDLLLNCQSITAVCRILRIGWHQACRVMHRAVGRGQLRKKPQLVRYIGVDEKAFRKGHHYLTVVSDLSAGAVEYVAEHRTHESLAGYYKSLSPQQLAGIEAVAMDMYKAYVQATRELLPGGEAKIVFDRFHIMKNMNDTLDRIRQSEHFELSKRRDNTLARTRQMWLWGQENLPEKYQDRFALLKREDLRTARAWAIKEHLRRLWQQPDVAAARAFFDHWHQWVKGCGMTPLIRLAKTFAGKIEQIVNYCRHPITTAGCEGLNSKITTVKLRAAGFRNFEHFKTAILFYCGNLSLYP